MCFMVLGRRAAGCKVLERVVSGFGGRASILDGFATQGRLLYRVCCAALHHTTLNPEP